jgi:hypothetical protein
MALNELQVWAECNDGHTTFAGLNVDEFTIGELCKWAGVIRMMKLPMRYGLGRWKTSPRPMEVTND